MSKLKLKERLTEDLEYGILNTDLEIKVRRKWLLSTTEKEVRDELTKQIEQLIAGQDFIKEKLKILQLEK